jgi:hypothetical protein
MINRIPKKFFKHALLFIIVAFGLVGCATTGSYTPDGVKITDINLSLKNGDIRFACEVSCSFSDGLHRRERKKLHDNALWHDLAIDVINEGFKSDQNYYYLGRSAEGLGYYDAALTYYKLAKTVFKCGGVIDNCDGLVFPRDIDERLIIIKRSIDNQKPTPQITKQAETPTTSMNRKSDLSESPSIDILEPTLNKLPKKHFDKVLAPNPQTGKLE